MIRLWQSMERFSVDFEPDPSDDEAHILLAELKKLGATQALDWLWVFPSDLELPELRRRLRKFRRAEDFVVEKVDRTEYRNLLSLARQSRKNPSKPSVVRMLYTLMKRGRPN